MSAMDCRYVRTYETSFLDNPRKRPLVPSKAPTKMSGGHLRVAIIDGLMGDIRACQGESGTREKG
jgi:hypothetical protein